MKPLRENQKEIEELLKKVGIESIGNPIYVSPTTICYYDDNKNTIFKIRKIPISGGISKSTRRPLYAVRAEASEPDLIHKLRLKKIEHVPGIVEFDRDSRSSYKIVNEDGMPIAIQIHGEEYIPISFQKRLESEGKEKVLIQVADISLALSRAITSIFNEQSDEKFTGYSSSWYEESLKQLEDTLRQHFGEEISLPKEILFELLKLPLDSPITVSHLNLSYAHVRFRKKDGNEILQEGELVERLKSNEPNLYPNIVIVDHTQYGVARPISGLCFLIDAEIVDNFSEEDIRNIIEEISKRQSAALKKVWKVHPSAASIEHLKKRLYAGVAFNLLRCICYYIQNNNQEKVQSRIEKFLNFQEIILSGEEHFKKNTKKLENSLKIIQEKCK